MATAAVTLYGRFIDTIGAVARGEVGVRLVSLLDGDGATPASNGTPVRVTLNTQGEFSLTLPPPPDPTTGAVYEITESFNMVANATYYIAVAFDIAPHTLDLAYLSPTGYAVEMGDTQYLTRIQAARTYATQASLRVVVDTLSSDILDLQNTRATKVYVDSKLAAVSFQIENLQRTKADLNYVNEQLNLKPDLDLMISRLALKADLSYVDRKLTDKADTVDVLTGLGNKVDRAEFNAYVANGIQGGGGANASDLEAAKRQALLNTFFVNALFIGS